MRRFFLPFDRPSASRWVKCRTSNQLITGLFP